jgi:hypothetical protein
MFIGKFIKFLIILVIAYLLVAKIYVKKVSIEIRLILNNLIKKNN